METIEGVRILRVVDADTIKILIPQGSLCGVDSYGSCSCRLSGIDAPEKHTTAGKSVALIIQRMYPHWKEASLIIHQLDKYAGRLNGSLIIDGVNLALWLLEKELVKKYEGGTRYWTFQELQQVEQKTKVILSQVNWTYPYL